jgi:hypothetical protein
MTFRISFSREGRLVSCLAGPRDAFAADVLDEVGNGHGGSAERSLASGVHHLEHFREEAAAGEDAPHWEQGGIAPHGGLEGLREYTQNHCH